MTTILEQGNITIHTENIFPIIKKALYSEHEIFLRELVSNAVDAIKKLSMVSRSGEYSGDISNPEIEIKLDKDKKILSVSDTGIGMTADEVKQYINQVAFSSAEEFITKYKDSAAEDPIIGHFGLGFYSSFMVASTVEIDTLSYREGAEAVHWNCDGTTQFSLSPSERDTVGTTITLHLMEGEEEYLEPARIRQLIKTYCDFMPVPIKLDGEVVNKRARSPLSGPAPCCHRWAATTSSRRRTASCSPKWTRRPTRWPRAGAACPRPRSALPRPPHQRDRSADTAGCMRIPPARADRAGCAA